MVISENKIKRNIISIRSEVLNGENYNRSDFARSLLNYPAMMVPSVQEPIIEELSDVLNNEVSLLDPFMGASNTLVTGIWHECFWTRYKSIIIIIEPSKNNLLLKRRT